MSKKLRFSAVIAYQTEQERVVLRQLGQLERRRADILAHVQALIEQRYAASQRVDMISREQLSRYWQHSEIQVQQLHVEQSKIEGEINVVRLRLAECHRAVKMFQELQQRELQQNDQRRARRQQQAMDEFAARRQRDELNHEAHPHGSEL